MYYFRVRRRAEGTTEFARVDLSWVAIGDAANLESFVGTNYPANTLIARPCCGYLLRL